MPLFVRVSLASLILLFSLTVCRAQTASANNVPPPKKTSPGIFGLGFSNDGRTIATGNFNGTVKLWDVPSGRLLRTLDGHELAGGHTNAARKLDERTPASTVVLDQEATKRVKRSHTDRT